MSDEIYIPVKLVGLERVQQQINQIVASLSSKTAQVGPTTAGVAPNLAAAARSQRNPLTGLARAAHKEFLKDVVDFDVFQQAAIDKSIKYRDAERVQQEKRITQLRKYAKATKKELESGIVPIQFFEQRAAETAQRYRKLEDAKRQRRISQLSKHATKAHAETLTSIVPVAAFEEAAQETSKRYKHLNQLDENYRNASVRERRMMKKEREYRQLDVVQSELQDDKRIQAQGSKALRRAQAQQRLDKMTHDRERRMSQATMGLASAGIGLLGTPGFAFLNVAFASMSGMKWAGVAAVATATGEAVRGLMNFHDACLKASESLGLVTKEYKMTKGRQAMAEAVYGSYMQPSEEDLNKRWTKFVATRPGGLASSIYGRLSSEWLTGRSWTMALAEHPLRSLFNLTAPGMIASAPGRLSKNIGLIGQGISDVPGAYERLRKAREQFIEEHYGFRASWQGPEEMYKKIQSAAASRIPDEERIFREQLRTLDGILEELKKQNKSSLIETPSGRAHGFFSYQ